MRLPGGGDTWARFWGMDRSDQVKSKSKSSGQLEQQVERYKKDANEFREVQTKMAALLRACSVPGSEFWVLCMLQASELALLVYAHTCLFSPFFLTDKDSCREVKWDFQSHPGWCQILNPSLYDPKAHVFNHWAVPQLSCHIGRSQGQQEMRLPRQKRVTFVT